MKTATERSRAYRARQKAIRDASQNAATVLATIDATPVTTTATPAAQRVLAAPCVEPRVEVIPPVRRSWQAVGRAGVGTAIVGTGAFIAYTSMRANSWFGHSLTPDPAAGEIYATLSVAAEVLACLIPTASRFYVGMGDRWTAFRGWALMAVALTVVFFAAGGFAVTNMSLGTEARAERESPAVHDLRAQIAALDRSISAECVKRGDKCRSLEAQRADANAKLSTEREAIRSVADPQAQALGISSANLHLVQASSMVALCLFSGLFISFGAGLIWPKN